MGAPQKYPTRRAQAEAIVAAVLDDPDAILAELVRRGALVEVRSGVYRRVAT